MEIRVFFLKRWIHGILDNLFTKHKMLDPHLLETDDPFDNRVESSFFRYFLQFSQVAEIV